MILDLLMSIIEEDLMTLLTTTGACKPWPFELPLVRQPSKVPEGVPLPGGLLPRWIFRILFRILRGFIPRWIFRILFRISRESTTKVDI